jgi:SAM-dependent methyltransferase
MRGGLTSNLSPRTSVKRGVIITLNPGKYAGLRGAVALSHFLLRERVRAGDRVVDATCGNGHDTLLLAQLVGPTGRVWAFDIQAAALSRARGLLLEAGCMAQTELVAAGHERLREFVAAPLRAVVFNLGYLPGGDKSCVTRPEQTLVALQQVADLLLPGGVVTIAVYTGHPGGAEEGEAIEAWTGRLPPALFNVWHCRQPNRSATAPYLVVVEKVSS